jgi:hypothetical protein
LVIQKGKKQLQKKTSKKCDEIIDYCSTLKTKKAYNCKSKKMKNIWDTQGSGRKSSVTYNVKERIISRN